MQPADETPTVDPTEPTATEPTATVHFMVDRADATAVLAAWLRSRRFAPTALKEQTGFTSLQSTYLPHWAISARTTSDYVGERGEHYWVTRTSTSTDAQGNTTSHSHRQRRTRWRPASGTVTRAFADILVPATGAGTPKWLAKVGPWPLADAVPYRPDDVHGHRCLPNETPLPEALAQAKAQLVPIIEDDCLTDIGGDDQRVASVRTTYDDVTDKLVLLPAWIGSYQPGDKRYEVMINGCTGEVSGDRPYSVAKITVAVALALAVVAAVIATILLTR